MLTYQLQRRIYRLDDGTAFSFPSDVEITLELLPPGVFGGDGSDPLRTVKKDTALRLTWNANNGSWFVQPSEALEPVDVSIEMPLTTFRCVGNTATYRMHCGNLQSLDDAITALHFMLPLMLNVDFEDPPVVGRTFGSVGGTSFRWELRRLFVGHIDVTTTSTQEERIERAFKSFELVTGTKNRRFAAALNYFHIACRLARGDGGPWEFGAERILNCTKVLQVLFGESRDDVRTGLRSLGYADEDIEADFMPVMLLRNEFDVGHVSIAIQRAGQLESVYRYLDRVERYFRDLLSRVRQALEDGGFKLTDEPDLVLDPDKRKIMDGIVASIEVHDDLT